MQWLGNFKALCCLRWRKTAYKTYEEFLKLKKKYQRSHGHKIHHCFYLIPVQRGEGIYVQESVFHA